MRYSTMANVQLNLEFIPSNRGGRLLVFQGCLYKCKKKRGTWQSWECKTKDCSARLSTKDDVIANIGVDHNHVINPVEIKVYIYLHLSHFKTLIICSEICWNQKSVDWWLSVKAKHIQYFNKLHVIIFKVQKSVEDIKHLVAHTTASLPTLYKVELNKLRGDGPWTEGTTGLITKMPTLESTRSSLYRSRQKALPKVYFLLLIQSMRSMLYFTCNNLFSYLVLCYNFISISGSCIQIRDRVTRCISYD